MKRQLTLERAGEIMRSLGYPGMTELQKTALRSCTYAGGAREFIIGDTSSGKTLVPLVAFQAGRLENAGCKLLYVLPYRALAAQKQADLERIFPGLDIKMSTSEFSASDDAISMGRCDIGIIIYEKAALFLAKNSGFLSCYSHILFDEIGIVEVMERGFKADYLLNHACRNTGGNLYLLATPYFDWTPYITCYGFQERRETSRPVIIETSAVVIDPPKAGQQDSRQSFKENLRQRREDIEKECLQKIAGLCGEQLAAGHKVLIFANDRMFVRRLARSLNEKLYGGKWRENFSIAQGRQKLLDNLYMSEADILSVFGEEEDIKAYYNGITFHNASLPEDLREKIEGDFLGESNRLQIVCATETLAFGLNSNVDTVIIARLDKKDGGEPRKLTTNEYRNYIGRSGRFGSREKGFAYTICRDRAEYKHWQSLDAPSAQAAQLQNSFTEERLDAKNMLMFLHFYDSREIISIRQLIEVIHSFPIRADDASLEEAAKEAVAHLKQRDLIREGFNEKTLEEGCRITDRGRSILGYIIDMETYDKLARNARWLFRESTPLFDFLHEICSCPEISVTNGAALTPERAAEKYGWIAAFLEKLRKEGNISPQLYASITRNKSLGFFKRGNLSNGKFKNIPQPEDRRFLYSTLFQTAMYSWMRSVNLTQIADRTGVEYQRLQSKGAKIKYIIDAMLNTFSDDLPRGAYTRMELIGASCYYGVRLDVLTEMMRRGIFTTVDEIEPMDGRQLRMISQVLTERPNISPGQLKVKIQRCKKVKAPYYAYLTEKCDFREQRRSGHG